MAKENNMAGTNLKDMFKIWEEQTLKIAEGSEEARLAAAAIPGKEREATATTPDYPGSVSSPPTPTGSGTTGGAPSMANQTTSPNPAASIIAPSGGTGTETDDRPYLDSNPDLDNEDLMKEANAITELANSITADIINKSKRAKTAHNTPEMQLTPEVLNKLASIVAATKDGANMTKSAQVRNYINNFIGVKQAQAQQTPTMSKYAQDLQTIFNYGQEMAEYDRGVKMAEAVVNDPMFKLGQEMALEEMGAMPPVDMGVEGGDEDLTVGDVADELLVAVETGELQPEEADDILELVIEDAVGSAVPEEQAMDAPVTPEEIVEAVTELVEEGLDPDVAAEIVSELVEGGDEEELVM